MRRQTSLDFSARVVTDLIGVRDANNHFTEYVYDADNRRSRIIDPLGDTTTLADPAVVARLKTQYQEEG